MSMATMNPAAGGPVGGMMIMNNGSPALGDGMRDNTDYTKLNLNSYIYDYLLKQGHYDIARSMSQDSSFKFNQKAPSPGRRKDGDMNGDAGDGMDVDAKDDAPDDLPRPRNWDGTQGNGFLLDWFAIFSDLFTAHRNQNIKGPAGQYLQNERQSQKFRESMQNQNMNRNMNMNPAMMQQMRAGMANGKMPGQVTSQQLQAIQQKRAQQMQMNMARGEGADGDMNGVRPSTPAEGDGTGSPSKRPRIDNGAQNFPQGMMPNGRPAGVPGGPNAGGMLMQTGFAPNGMPQQFRQNGAMPPKTMQGAMPNGMMNMNMANASSPMMNQFGDGSMQMDMYNRQNMPGNQMQGGGGAAQSGNHALQDYQMQLMLLEQQNKKRLMMARQEQHENNPGAAGMPGVNMPGGMSPSGRSGTSPNPDMAAGRSPSAMNAFNMQNNNFDASMFMGKDQPMMGGPNMRPPTSNMPPGARPGQFPGGQPMQQQGSQPGQQLGTPGQRTDMPPPQAPANGAQRNNGNSPQNQNQPPTPSQTNKANPKNKKNASKDDNKKQRPAKKGSMANAQNDDNPPATPTPSTPITPNNPGAANAANKGQPGLQQQQQPQQNMMNQPMQQNGMDNFGFGDATGTTNEQFNLDFSTLENADVLENFDFDSFLNTSADDAFNFTADVDLGNDFNMDAGQ